MPKHHNHNQSPGSTASLCLWIVLYGLLALVLSIYSPGCAGFLVDQSILWLTNPRSLDLHHHPPHHPSLTQLTNSPTHRLTNNPPTTDPTNQPRPPSDQHFRWHPATWDASTPASAAGAAQLREISYFAYCYNLWLFQGILVTALVCLRILRYMRIHPGLKAFYQVGGCGRSVGWVGWVGWAPFCG
jgi:hypothetical protein